MGWQCNYLCTLLDCLTACLQYADRLPIGEEEIIRSVPGQRVRDFYRTWYRPDNMAVIAVGDFANVEVFLGVTKLASDASFGVEFNLNVVVMMAS